MTTPYEVVARLEALEMNSMNEGRMVAALERMATEFGALNRTVEAIYDVLRDVAEHLEAEDEPDA